MINAKGGKISGMKDKDSWDFAHAVRGKPVKNGRAIVSVAFSRAEFDTVAQAALASGQTVSGFIRASASLSHRVSFSWNGMSEGVSLVSNAPFCNTTG